MVRMTSSDPRATAEFRIPAASLRPGDIVNNVPGEDDWQEVLSVHTKPASGMSEELRALAEMVDGRYVIVEMTDIQPMDNGVYFVDGTPMTYGEDDRDQPLADVISLEDGSRTYVYTRYELVTVRSRTAD
jgi:hypothetical protein